MPSNFHPAKTVKASIAPMATPGTERNDRGARLAPFNTELRRRGCLFVALAASVFCCLGMSAAEGTPTAPPKLGFRVIYYGHPQSTRAKDFVGFLEKHFAKVGQGDLDAFSEPDGAAYDVTILDYGELKLVSNHLQLPKKLVSKQYSRPTVTIGATGALVCGRMGLKTGYL